MEANNLTQATTKQRHWKDSWKRTRESRLILSVTPAEAKTIKTLAQGKGKTMQDYLMSLVLEDVAAAKNGGA
jgi:hypothetical protein